MTSHSGQTCISNTNHSSGSSSYTCNYIRGDVDSIQLNDPLPLEIPYGRNENERECLINCSQRSSKLQCMQQQGIKVVTNFFLVLGIAIAWVGATQFSTSTYTATFNAPLFNVWFSTSWLVLVSVSLVIPQVRSSGITEFSNTCPNKETTSLSPLFWIRLALLRFIKSESRLSNAFISAWLGISKSNLHATKINSNFSLDNGVSTTEADPLYYAPITSNHLTWTHVIRFSLPFTLLWVGANYLYVKALGIITATDVTAVFSITPAFVYILSLKLLGDRLSLLKVTAVAAAIAGVLMLALSENDAEFHAEGILLTLASSLCAALYKVSFKVVLGDAGLPFVIALLSVISTLNIFIVCPLWFLLQQTDAESFDWDSIPWLFLCGSAILGLAFNFLVNFGVAYTTPLFVSLGTVVGIPLNAAADRLFRAVSLGSVKIGGCCLILISFLLMLIPRKFLNQT